MRSVTSTTDAGDQDGGSASPPLPTGRLLMWVAVLAGIGAAAIAGYLTWQSVIHGAMPVGCGEGSGCGEVLASKYARLWGMPVSALALVTYIALVVMVGSRGHAAGRYLVMTLAVAILISAGWFVYLQLAVLKAICLWCMADHALGAVAALTSLVLAFCAQPALSRRLIVNSIVAGVALSAMLAISQWTSDERVMVLEGVEVSFLEDRFNLNVALEPHIGSPTAERKLFLLFDYACLHCQAVHDRLKQLQARRDDLVLVLLPASIEPRCNPIFDTVADRFAGSCELAELAMAVHLIDPEQFVRFDEWLFAWEGSTSRSVEAARARAEALVGADRLAAILADGLPRQALDRNVRLLAAMSAGRVPVMVTPGRPPIVGRVDDDELIEAWLSGGAEPAREGDDPDSVPEHDDAAE